MHFHIDKLTSTNHCSRNGDRRHRNKRSNNCTTNTSTLWGLKVLLLFCLKSKGIVCLAIKRKRPRCGGPWHQSQWLLVQMAAHRCRIVCCLLWGCHHDVSAQSGNYGFDRNSDVCVCVTFPQEIPFRDGKRQKPICSTVCGWVVFLKRAAEKVG